MLRTLTILILLLPVVGLAAERDSAPYAGRHVADVIDEFRETGNHSPIARTSFPRISLSWPNPRPRIPWASSRIFCGHMA